MVTESSQTLFDTATSLFASLCLPPVLARAESGEWLAAEWKRLEELELPGALIPESAGGFGIDPSDALNLIRIGGAHALPLPLAETMMASWLLARASLPIPKGPLTVAAGEAPSLTLERLEAGWRLRGLAKRVAWGGAASALAIITEHGGQILVGLLQQAQWKTARGSNLAGEPRDDLSFDATLSNDAISEAPSGLTLEHPRLMGAAMRSLAIAGALERVLDLSVQYAAERVQFGRPIGKFQAVQQNLAVLAGEAAAAGGAADMAADAVAAGMDVLPIAAAKIRTGEAAGRGAAIAHQIHGAIGFTREHRLHFFTTRLWSWREEFGNEAGWSLLAGRQALGGGGKALWPLIASV